MEPGASRSRDVPRERTGPDLTRREPIKILAGVKILSVTQFLVGPAAVQYLSDLGADVIKIEPPGRGAWERTWSGAETFVNGVSLFFMLSHRNVRSVTANLKHDEGQKIVKQLAAEADVLVENFRPGVLERFGLGYEDMKSINPQLIYASASGYGQDSPYRHLPGQDLLVQALSGLAAITGRQEDPPTPAGAAIVDQHCAAILGMAVLAALFDRERTGEGQRVDVSLLQAALDLQLEPVVYHLNGSNIQRPRAPLGSSFHPAPYGIYETRDGYLALSLSPLDSIAEALGSPSELERYRDPRLATVKKEEIREALDQFFRSRSTEESMDLLRANGIWCAPVHEYDAVFADPAVEHLDPILEFDHPEAGRVRVLKHPARFSSGETELRVLPPKLGEHTDEVLSGLGYGTEDIERLRRAGAV